MILGAAVLADRVSRTDSEDHGQPSSHCHYQAQGLLDMT